MNIEDTFQNYVRNNFSGNPSLENVYNQIPLQAGVGQNTASVLPLHKNSTAGEFTSPSMLQKVWGWVKKWIGFIIFLIVAVVCLVLWWRRKSKQAPAACNTQTQPPQTPPLCPHEGDLNEEYVGNNAASKETQEEEEFQALEQIVSETKISEGKEEEEEMDDFDKMLLQEVKKRNENRVPKHPMKSKEPTEQSSSKEEINDEDFDTLEMLHNA